MAFAKEKSRKSSNLLRIKKGLKKKKKAYEFSTLVDVDACMIIYEQCPVEPETYPNNSQEVYRIIQPYRECISTTTSVVGEQDDALQKGGFLFNFEIEEKLKNEFMGFDQQNVKINQMIIIEEEGEEEENLLDSSYELDEILNAFGDNADDQHQENMFDLLPLSPPPLLPLTNAFIDNILDGSFDNWPTYSMVEWDQLFI